MIKFDYFYSDNIVLSRPYYYSEDLSIDMFPNLNSDVVMLVAYINIGFDSDNMYANQIWGFSPKDSWVKTNLTLPKFYKSGVVKIRGNLDPGTWRLDKKKQWKTFFDRTSGWLCIGNPKLKPSIAFIEFAIDSIMAIDENHELHALWVKPTIK